MKYKIILKKLVITLSVAGLIFSIAGCSNTSENVSSSSDTDSSELEGAVGKKVSTYEGYLGYGYDIVNSGYYSEEYVNASAPVLDMDSLAAGGYVRIAPMQKTVTNMISGWSFTDILVRLSEYSGLSIDVGFVASANDFYETSVNTNSNSYYVLLNSEIRKQREVINAKKSVYANYLTDNFIEDIDSLSADEILEKYGSYVMTDIQLGGRLVLSYVVENSQEESRQTLDEEVTIAVRDTTEDDLWEDLTTGEDSLDESLIETDDNVAETETEGNSSENAADEDEAQSDIQVDYSNITSMYCYFTGGNIDLSSDATQISSSYTAWADSVDNGSISLINCTSGIWIWDLIDLVDSDKASEVKDAYTNLKDDVYDEVTEEYGEETSGEQSIDEVDNEGTM